MESIDNQQVIYQLFEIWHNRDILTLESDDREYLEIHALDLKSRLERLGLKFKYKIVVKEVKKFGQ